MTTFKPGDRVTKRGDLPESNKRGIVSIVDPPPPQSPDEVFVAWTMEARVSGVSARFSTWVMAGELELAGGES